MKAKEFVTETINPDCFNPAFNDTQHFDGLTYRATVEEEYGKPVLTVKVLDDNFQQAGVAKFKASKKGVTSLITSFRPEYQGQGLARNIYAYVRALGNTIVPSRNQLPAGRAMWDSWKKSGDAKHLMRDVAENNHWHAAGMADAERDIKRDPDRKVKKLNPRTRLKTMQHKQARHPAEVEQYSLGYRSINPAESICSLAEAHEIFDDFEQAMTARGLNEDAFDNITDEDIIRETAAWRRSAGKSKKGGLNAKGVASYRRENPGSKLQMAVTTKPSKLKPGSKAAKRRKSFCARMSGVKGPMKKPNGKPTRKALALRKWNC